MAEMSRQRASRVCSPSSNSSTSSSPFPSPARKRARLPDINAHLTCFLCDGYFVDATSIIECLHTFCRSCIVKHFETNKCCPRCETLVHKTKPHLSIKPDKMLQDIVYKLVPDVFKNEMQRRVEFYKHHPEASQNTSAEDRGEIVDQRIFYMPQDKISLSLEYGFGNNQAPDNESYSSASNHSTEFDAKKRYLLCPAGMSIFHLKKFICQKYGLPNTYRVEIMYCNDVLSDEWALMDVAYIFGWRRNDPMRLFYQIKERARNEKRLKVSHQQSVSDMTNNKTNNRNDSDISRSNHSASNNIMTGAASMIPSNNGKGKTSRTTGVTSTAATPKNVDVKSKAYSVSSAVASDTPQGTSTGDCVRGAQQLDEPPKKLRKILPAKNATPKTVASATSAPSSTGNSLRHCRINDKNKSVYISARETSQMQFHGSSTKTANGKSGACTSTSSATKTTPNTTANSKPSSSFSSASNNSTNDKPVLARDSSALSKKNCNKRSFDVCNLIGRKSPPKSPAKSPPHSSHGIETSGYKNMSTSSDGMTSEAVTNRSIVTNKGIIIVREEHGNANRQAVSSTSGSKSTTSESQIGTGFGGIKKATASCAPRPPTRPVCESNLHKEEKSCDTSNASSHRSGLIANESPKQHCKSSAKDSCSNNDGGNNRFLNNDNEMAMKETNSKSNKVVDKPIALHGNASSRSSSNATPSTTPAPAVNRQLSSLSKLHIKLPPPPNKCSNKSSPSTTTAEEMVPKFVQRPQSTHQHSTPTKQSPAKQEQSWPAVESQVKQSRSAVDSAHDSGPKPAHCHRQESTPQRNQNIKSSLNSAAAKQKGASINQIVNKIASAKSASVNVTSTTSSLEMGKPAGSATKSTASLVNDDKVSTTTNESGVSSSVASQKKNGPEESAMRKAVTASNGNLVIRIPKSVVDCKSDKSASDKSSTKFVDKTENQSTVVPANSTKVRDNVDVVNDKVVTQSCLYDKSSVKDDVDNSDDEDDEDIPGGGKLVVVVDEPQDDSNEPLSDAAVPSLTAKMSSENDDIDSGRGSDIVRMSCDDTDIGSPQSTTLSIKTPDSVGTPGDVSSSSCKLPANISSTTSLSTSSAVLSSPPPTPSPKSDGDACLFDKLSLVSASPTSSLPNTPLDLSTHKKEPAPHSPSTLAAPAAIYDIPSPVKPKHCVNPAVLDKHRGLLFAPSTLNKQHAPFAKIFANTCKQANNPNVQSSSAASAATNLGIAGKRLEKSMPGLARVSGVSSGGHHSSGHHQTSHHNSGHNPQSSRNHHNNHKNYTVVSPDPHHGYSSKMVIRNISSPPSMSSHHHHH